MALSNRSLQQAKQVLKEILDSNVDVIVTRATLDQKIELVKFPYLKSSHDRYRKNGTLYTNQQYNKIRYWMVSTGFLKQVYSSNKYWYYVNKIAIRNYFDLGILPVIGYSTERPAYITRKEKTFQHIEANGNQMKYTDIIKFAFEDKHGNGRFDKKENRGHYSGAFRKNATLYNGYKLPDGHFVKENPKGYLIKLPNGLWSVCRPENLAKNKNESVYASSISEVTKSLLKEIEEIGNRALTDKKNYMIVWKCEPHDLVEGTFTEQELKNFFVDRSVDNYYVVEIAKTIDVTKSVTIN